MTQRLVTKDFSLEDQRQEINQLAADQATFYNNDTDVIGPNTSISTSGTATFGTSPSSVHINSAGDAWVENAFYVGDLTSPTISLTANGTASFGNGNHVLNADGTATFKKYATFGDSTNMPDGTGGIKVYRNRTDPDDVARINIGESDVNAVWENNTNFNLKYDGSATFGSGTTEISNDGNVQVDGTINVGGNVAQGSNGILLDGAGWSKFTGIAVIGDTSSTYVQLKPEGDLTILDSSGSTGQCFGISRVGDATYSVAFTADGKAEFDTSVQVGTGVPGDNSGTAAGTLITNGSIETQAASGNVFVGRAASNGAATSSIGQDGSASFVNATVTHTIVSGADPYTDQANVGQRMDPSSGIIARSAGSNQLWTGYQTGSGDVKSEIKADGTAIFAADVTVSSGHFHATGSSTSTKTFISSYDGTENAIIKADGTAWFTNVTVSGASFTSTNINEWNMAYVWGDHSVQGYLTSESDTLQTITDRGNSTTGDIIVNNLTVNGNATTLTFSNTPVVSLQVDNHEIVMNAGVGIFTGDVIAGDNLISNVTSTAGIEVGDSLIISDNAQGLTLPTATVDQITVAGLYTRQLSDQTSNATIIDNAIDAASPYAGQSDANAQIYNYLWDNYSYFDFDGDGIVSPTDGQIFMQILIGPAFNGTLLDNLDIPANATRTTETDIRNWYTANSTVQIDRGTYDPPDGSADIVVGNKDVYDIDASGNSGVGTALGAGLLAVRVFGGYASGAVTTTAEFLDPDDGGPATWDGTNWTMGSAINSIRTTVNFVQSTGPILTWDIDGTGGTGYSVSSSPEALNGGTGSGALIMITGVDGNGGVTGTQIYNDGTEDYDGDGYTVGDVLTIIGGNDDCTITITGLEYLSGRTGVELTAAIDPTLNATIRAERSAEPDAAIIWNEAIDKWQFTNDGTTYQDITSATGAVTQIAATNGIVINGSNTGLLSSNIPSGTIGLAFQNGIVPGSYTNADITVDQYGIVTAVNNGTGGSGAGITLADISVGANGTATATGGIAYNNNTGVFTYTPQTTFDGNYNSLSNLPSLFDGNYNSLSNLPTLFSGDYNALSNLPSLFDGDYNSLSNLPSLFDGDYDNLTNKPALFSGSYTDLTNKPTIPVDLNDLGDVLVPTPTDGYVLKWDSGAGSGGAWVSQPDLTASGGSGIALGDLSVGPNGTASGSGGLGYNNTNGVFTYTPADLSGYSTTSHSHSFVSLSDTPGTFLADKWLKVNSGGTALEWGDAPAGANLSTLGDVNITTPVNDQVIKYENGSWVNKADDTGTTINAINDIGDVNIDSGTLANNQILKYDSTANEWKNEPALEGGNLTIGVRSGTALNIGFTGTTFNVVNRAGGNVPITI